MMNQTEKTKPQRPGPGRLSAEDAAKLPDRLLDAASALFLENGYAKATMEGIARRAQASTKTVYSRYQNKAEILAAVIRRLVERTVARVSTDIGAKPDMSNPRKFLVDLGVQFATLVSSPQTVGINRLVISEAPNFPELVLFFAAGPGRIAGVIRTALEQWQREGKLPLMPEPAVAATIFYDLVASTPRMRALLGPPLSPKAIKEHVDIAVTLFLRGCGFREEPSAKEAIAKRGARAKVASG